MSSTVGMISGAISGKALETKSAAVQGAQMKNSFVSKMNETGPEAIEMPENVTESGMMMGAMVMAKPSLAGGLPGAMAPPEGMTSIAMGKTIAEGGPGMGEGLGDVMGGLSEGDMGEHMSAMTGMEMDDMDKLGMTKMVAQTGLTPGMVATMGSAGMAGMDVTSVMSTNVAGLGSETVKGLANMAAEGSISTAVRGDMMAVGVVNQGTMAAMGAKGMEGLSGAMGMEGGDMGLAAMSGGMIGMGTMDMNTQMDPDMAAAMGVTAGPEGATLGDVLGSNATSAEDMAAMSGSMVEGGGMNL